MPYETPPPPGSIGEISADRTPVAKRYDMGGGEKVLRSHIGRIHYWDQFDLDGSGVRYRETDTTLVALGGGLGWEMADKYGDYYAHVARRSNGFTTFKNFEPDNRGTDEAAYDEIGIRVPVAVPQSVVGVKTGPLTVNYPAAFNRGGVDMDLEVSCYNMALRHEVVIPSQPTGIGPEMPLVFELDIPAGLDIEINDIDWVDRTGEERTTQAIRIGKAGTPKSEWIRLRRFKVWDDDGSEVPVDVTFEETSPGLVTMTKLVPRSFLMAATYPVRTDATLSPFSSAGDGMHYGTTDTNWDTIHDSTSESATYTGDNMACITRWNDPNYEIKRAFLPFDTSALPDSPSISAADVNVMSAGSPIDSDSTDICLVESTQASPDSVANADFDNIGTTLLASRVNVADWASIFNWETLDLNAAGLALIDDAGNTMFCFITGLDYDDTAPTVGHNIISVRTSEYTGTSSDPYFDITYTEGGGGGGFPKSRWHQYKQLLHH